MYSGCSWRWRLSTGRRFVHRKISLRRLGAHFSRGQSQHDQRADTLQMGHRSHCVRGAGIANGYTNLARGHGHRSAARSSVLFAHTQERHHQRW